jgi:hypothetical protein
MGNLEIMLISLRNKKAGSHQPPVIRFEILD